MPDAMSRGADAVPQEGDFTFGAEHVHADYWCAACIEEGHRRAALSVPAPTHEHNGKPCSCGVPAPTLPALDGVLAFLEAVDGWDGYNGDNLMPAMVSARDKLREAVRDAV